MSVLHPIRTIERKVDAAARRAVRAELVRWALGAALVFVAWRNL